MPDPTTHPSREEPTVEEVVRWAIGVAEAHEAVAPFHSGEEEAFHTTAARHARAALRLIERGERYRALLRDCAARLEARRDGCTCDLASCSHCRADTALLIEATDALEDPLA